MEGGEEHIPKPEPAKVDVPPPVNKSPIPSEPVVEAPLTDDHYRIIAEAQGSRHDTTLGQAAITAIHHPVDDRDRQILETAFAAHGIDIPAEVFPEYFASNLKDFTDADWERIKASPDPLVAIHAVKNYHYDLWRINVKPGNAYDQIAFRSLPLIHGTSYTALEQIMERERVLSNRELLEAEGAKAAVTGHTYLDDRKVGLDRYVYADYGRPHRRRAQADVMLILSPDVLSHPGTFITSEDYMDVISEESVSKRDPAPLEMRALERYLRHTSMPPYFFEEAVNKLLTDGVTPSEFAEGGGEKSDSLGQPSFSTWEVKIPEVGKDKIAKAVFRDKGEMERFREKYGDQGIEIVYAPDIRPGNYRDSFGTGGEYEKAADSYLNGNYEERAEMLARLPEDQKRRVTYLHQTQSPWQKKFLDGVLGERTDMMRLVWRSNPRFSPVGHKFSPPYFERDERKREWQGTIVELEIPISEPNFQGSPEEYPSRVISLKPVTYDDLLKQGIS